jgi:hypothetical protein
MKEITVHDYVIGCKQLASEGRPAYLPTTISEFRWDVYIMHIQTAANRAREPGGICNPIDFDKLRAAHYAANLG